jgi:Holliday junction resolvase RusA-like endonuclease
MKHFRFTVFGQPKGQPRPRAFARKVGNSFVARVYDAGTAEGWKSLIALEAKMAGLAGAGITRPVSLEVYFRFKRPNSHFGTGRNRNTLTARAPALHHTQKPDLDNLMKAVKDCLTQIGAWKDDAQVCKEYASKRWEDYDGAEILVFEL